MKQRGRQGLFRRRVLSSNSLKHQDGWTTDRSLLHTDYTRGWPEESPFSPRISTFCTSYHPCVPRQSTTVPRFPPSSLSSLNRDTGTCYVPHRSRRHQSSFSLTRKDPSCSSLLSIGSIVLNNANWQSFSVFLRPNGTRNPIFLLLKPSVPLRSLKLRLVKYFNLGNKIPWEEREGPWTVRNTEL